ncbi:MAG: hypothetical protein LBJ92_03390 [Holosporales bacterium]|nr:hypothetical protein [Holosporales bacterium]
MPQAPTGANQSAAVQEKANELPSEKTSSKTVYFIDKYGTVFKSPQANKYFAGIGGWYFITTDLSEVTQKAAEIAGGSQNQSDNPGTPLAPTSAAPGAFPNGQRFTPDQLEYIRLNRKLPPGITMDDPAAASGAFQHGQRFTPAQLEYIRLNRKLPPGVTTGSSTSGTGTYPSGQGYPPYTPGYSQLPQGAPGTYGPGQGSTQPVMNYPAGQGYPPYSPGYSQLPQGSSPAASAPGAYAAGRDLTPAEIDYILTKNDIPPGGLSPASTASAPGTYGSGQGFAQPAMNYPSGQGYPPYSPGYSQLPTGAQGTYVMGQGSTLPNMNYPSGQDYMYYTPGYSQLPAGASPASTASAPGTYVAGRDLSQSEIDFILANNDLPPSEATSATSGQSTTSQGLRFTKLPS